MGGPNGPLFAWLGRVSTRRQGVTGMKYKPDEVTGDPVVNDQLSDELSMALPFLATIRQV